MTFLQIINEAKNKYQTTNQLVIFSILFKLSKKVQNKLDFTIHRNSKIDFNKNKFDKYLNDYFLKQKPLGQIVNSTQFCYLTIDIFKRIFEPRSETELITENIIKYLKQHPKLINGVDLCCGTGCIGITIKKYLPNINMSAVDINPQAIENTKHNAKLNKVKIMTYTGDFYQTLIDKKLKFDFIVCNPPYLDVTTMNKTMIKYENKISFTNSKDPLFFYHQLINNQKKILNRGGKIFFEDQNAELLII
jgi:release factor glutamine methyltransferase